MRRLVIAAILVALFDVYLLWGFLIGVLVARYGIDAKSKSCHISHITKEAHQKWLATKK